MGICSLGKPGALPSQPAGLDLCRPSTPPRFGLRMPSRHRLAGFSLTELMIALAILSIGLAAALPSFQRLIAGQRLVSSGNEILTVLHYARMEAVRQRVRVVVCPTSGGTACDGGANWAGAIVFTDTNRDGSRGTGEAILRRWDYRNSTLSLTQIAGSTPARMVFGASGLSRPGVAGAAMPRIRICNEGTTTRSSLVALEAGWAYTTKGNGNGCS